MHELRIRTRLGWRPLGRGETAPAIEETALFEIRGLTPGASLEIGSERAPADERGHARIKLLDSESLRGHLGLIEIRIDGSSAGEVDVLPGKVSADAYVRLRADLEAVWSGLVRDPRGVSKLQARLPSAAELWRRIERPVLELVDHPREVLVGGELLRKITSVRRTTELTPQLMQRGLRNLPGTTRGVVRSTATPEYAMVASTLRRLYVHARREGDERTAATLTRRLRDSTLLHHQSRRRGVTWAMRRDPVFRQVLDVERLLDRPELGATEGPGELRLGVRGMIRLYEYWVFLQVLLQARDLYGQPLEPGFEVLARRLGRDRLRLELTAGTTIEFPGQVFVAFEPTISTGSSGWMGLEYVPHPDPDRSQSFGTPDVAVLRAGDLPWLLVVDAKYVGRSWVEHSAARLHEKYARVLSGGVPVAHHVVAVHPHRDLTRMWAGYGHFGWAPSHPLQPLPLPRPAAVPPDPPVLPSTDDKRPVPSKTVIVADQYWMHQRLGSQRIDLDDLPRVAADDSLVDACHIVLPQIPQLDSFANALRRRDWVVHVMTTTARAESIERIIELTASLRRGGNHVVIVTGDPELRSLLVRAELDVEFFADLFKVRRLPAMRAGRS